MKANELRIGNLVLNNSKPFQIRDGEDIDDQAHFKCHEPIPLSEEWLIKFGFAIDHDGWWVINGSFGLLNKGQGFEPYMDCAKCLEYVHQLQNLYFCLTGEELALK